MLHETFAKLAQSFQLVGLWTAGRIFAPRVSEKEKTNFVRKGSPKNARKCATAVVISFAMLPGLCAKAGMIRFPESGKPAFVIITPDGWTHNLDGHGDMVLVSASHAATYALTIGEYSGSLDDLATSAMKDSHANAPRSIGTAEISGFHGYVYDSEIVSAQGAHVNIHMIAVKIGKHHMASITMMSAQSIGGDDFRVAQSILQNTMIESDAPRFGAVTTSVPAIAPPAAQTAATVAQSAAPSAITLRVCNHYSGEALVASSYIPVGESRWLNSGWTPVPVDRCVDIFKTKNDIFYAHAESNDGSRMHWGGDILQCVEHPGPYQFFTTSKDTDCPKGTADFKTFFTNGQSVMIWNLNP